MRGGRMLIIVGVVVLLGALVIGGVLWIRSRSQPAIPEEVEEGLEGVEGVSPYVPPEGMRDIVVAAEDISRSTAIVSGTVRIATWPEESVPEGALDSIADAVGRIARVDILQGMPIVGGMLTEEPGDLAAVGSDVALQIPRGKVAYALPVARYSSVAWALRPGDHVDVLISVLLVDLDEEFQTPLPNNASCVQPPEGEGCERGIMGRLEVLPNGWVVNLTPGGQQKQYPRLVTQLTIQDAVVLRVGDWPSEEEEKAVPAVEEGAEGATVQPAEGQQEMVTPQRAEVEPLTLIVSPQDAMVLKYAQELGASIDFVLRSAGEEAGHRFNTRAVTLQYLFDNFGLELPAKLPYGVTPPIQSLQPGATGSAETGEATGSPPVGE